MPLLEHKIGHLALYAFSLVSFSLDQESYRSSATWKRVVEFSRKGHKLTLSPNPTDNTEAVNVCRGLLLTTWIFSAYHLGELEQVQKSFKELVMLGHELNLPKLSSFEPGDEDRTSHLVQDSFLVLDQKMGSTISLKKPKLLLMAIMATV